MRALAVCPILLLLTVLLMLFLDLRNRDLAHTAAAMIGWFSISNLFLLWSPPLRPLLSLIICHLHLFRFSVSPLLDVLVGVLCTYE